MKLALREISGRICDPLSTVPGAGRLLFGGANIAYYHWIGDPAPHYAAFSSGCDIRRFRRHLDRLQAQFEIVPLSTLVGDRLERTAPAWRGRPSLAITFDDGFDLVRSGIMAELDSRSIKATVLLITSCIGNRSLMWRGKLSAIAHCTPTGDLIGRFGDLCRRHALPAAADLPAILRGSYEWDPDLAPALAAELWERCGMPSESAYLEKHRPYMGWDEIRVWTANGHEIGLHTETHPRCDRLSEEGIQREIVRPAVALRSELGVEFLPFSYPFGPCLPAHVAESLWRGGTVDCLLGTDGLSPRGTPPWLLNRAGLESGLHFPMFGRTMIRRALGQ